jgi:hypothetical protein
VRLGTTPPLGEKQEQLTKTPLSNAAADLNFFLYFPFNSVARHCSGSFRVGIAFA